MTIKHKQVSREYSKSKSKACWDLKELEMKWLDTLDPERTFEVPPLYLERWIGQKRSLPQFTVILFIFIIDIFSVLHNLPVF